PAGPPEEQLCVDPEELQCVEPDPVTRENLDRLWVILQHHPIQEVRQWARHGIQTVPLYLAAALVKLGYRWGQTYEGSKDAMHFELLARDEYRKGVLVGKGVLKPDAAPRPLEDLFAVAGVPPAPPPRKKAKAKQKAVK